MTRPVAKSALRAKTPAGGREQSAADQTPVETDAKRRLDDITRLVSDWVWETDRDFRLTFVSARVFQVLGFHPYELVGRTLTDLGSFTTEAGAPVELEWRSPFRDAPFEITDRDGQPRSFLVSGLPVFNMDTGAFGGVRGTAEDITERKRTEEALRLSEETFRGAIESLREGFALFDADDRLVICNDVYRHLHPAVADLLKPGLRFEDLTIANVRSGTIAEAVGREEEFIRRRLEQHRNPQGPIERQLTDGRWYMVAEGRTPDGGTYATLTEITALKKREAALRESELRLRGVIESVQEGFALYDAEDRLVLCNDEYRRLHPKTEDILKPGMRFEDLIRINVERRTNADAIGNEEEHLRERLEQHRNPKGPIVRRLTNGITYMIKEVRTPDGGIAVTETDITDLKRAEEELRLAATVFSATPDAIIVTDAENRIKAVNPGFTRITGYTADEVMGQDAAELWVDGPDGEFRRALPQALSDSGHWEGEVWGRRRDGETFPKWLSISAVKDPDGKVREHVIVFSDITKRKEDEEQIWRQANYDPLTELPNRSLFLDRLSQALIGARRENSRVSLLFIDLDRFKTVNDTLGHAFGDRVLVEAGKRLEACVRESDTVARFGGDEFTIILSDVGRPEDAAVVAEKVIGVLSKPFALDGQEAFTGASIGITAFPDDASDPLTMLRTADMAMYRAKEAGRNAYRFFTREMDTHALTRMTLEGDLRRALGRNEFTVYYQPIFDFRSGRVIAAEALLRWMHPTRGMVPPDEFIPLAEDTGLIDPIGEWVLRSACTQAKGWQQMGVGPLGVSVNLSSRQLKRGLSTQSVARVLEETGLPADLLTFEITEGLIMEDTSETSAWLGTVKQMGVKLSVDDFGTGYSSLSYLKRFPVDSVKIDRSFVRDVTVDPEDASLAEAIILLAHRLDLKAVAEGVETKQQFDFLRSRGCDLFQGYYFGRPMPAKEFEKSMRKGQGAPRARVTPRPARPVRKGRKTKKP